jgi:hypothetical protein
VNKQPPITLTYDQADLDWQSVQHARRLAIQSLIASGVNDLNAVTAEQLDQMFSVFKIAYENHLASRNHQNGMFNWRMTFANHATDTLVETPEFPA